MSSFARVGALLACLVVLVLPTATANAAHAPYVPSGAAAPDSRFPDIAPNEGNKVTIEPFGAAPAPGRVTTMGATLERYKIAIAGGGYAAIRDAYQRVAIGAAWDPVGNDNGWTFDVTYKPSSGNPDYYAGYFYGNSGPNGYPGAKGYQDCGWTAAAQISPATGIALSHGCPTTNVAVHGQGVMTMNPDHSYKYLDNGNCYPMDTCNYGSPATTTCAVTAYSNVWPLRDGGPAPADGSVPLDGMFVINAGTVVGWRYVTKNKVWAMVHITPPNSTYPEWVFVYFPCLNAYPH